MYIQNRDDYVELLDQLGCCFVDKKFQPISQSRLVERVRSEELFGTCLSGKRLATKNFTFQELTLRNRTLKAENFDPNDFNNYIYHYTDGKSAYNIICGGYIFPKKMGFTQIISNSNDILRESIIFTQINPNSNDLHLIKHLNQLTNKEIFKTSLRDKFNKINFAFGFKIEELKNLSKKNNTRHDFWEYYDKIDITSMCFVLVQRKFKYTTKDEFENTIEGDEDEIFLEEAADLVNERNYLNLKMNK